ncbi:hypothetical protein [uncultured Chryseobacterium sp.]|uniref:HTH-like domain-containing protein n=1 Tax=uncultured Chryseobacterium sp. TaxID=259322 RepID=UPI0025FC35BF|nr:hypothetical protein [uncultured Chryseobacterium sp.]
MEINELSKILSENYSIASNGDRVVQIHLFGVKYGKMIREKRYSVKDIIDKSDLNESYIAELNKGIKLSDKVIFDNEIELNTLGKILGDNFENAKNGETVASIYLFGIKYGKLIKTKNYSINDIIKISGINHTYFAELNKGIKLSEYLSIK